MKERVISFLYQGVETTVDLRRIVAISKPMSVSRFIIYFENTSWAVDEAEYDRVYNAWLNAL